MNFALLVVILAIGWAAATGSFAVLNLLFGAVVGALGLFLIRDRVQSPRLLLKLRQVLSLALLFVRELIVSAFRVAVLVARPNMRAHLKPGIIAFPLTVESDAEITLLANLITLTPGTLSVDVSANKKTLYVHAIAITDRAVLIDEIAHGFETKIARVFR